MPSPDEGHTRRQVLKHAGSLLSALAVGGTASATSDSDSNAASQSAEPLSGRPDIRSGFDDDSPDVEPLVNRPDIRR